MSFSDLGLSDELLKAISDAGYTDPTPIQAQAIPQVLMGRDILGCAQTGTGKTASFTLPMIDILASGRAKARMPRSLILEPTRELAAQVADNFEVYGKYHKLNHALLIGGENMSEQIKRLEKGVDVLIATPGRLMDVFDRGHLLLRDVKVLVIDEADRMLDMGFIPDVEKIVSKLPQMRTTLLFSATMPPEIKRLADRFLMNPKEITVSKPATAAETIKQLLVMVTGAGRDQTSIAKRKREVLRKLIEREQPKNAIIFCNRKRDVDVVYKSLERHGYNTAARLHGDMVQSVRMETLSKFKSGDVTLLVCSDVAARGLDIPAMSHVFNFDVPTHADDYVHRIGRTGRAGREGVAISIAVPSDGKYVDAIEKLMGRSIDQDPMSSTGGGSGSSGGGDDTASAPEKPEKEARSERGRGRGRDRGRSRKPASDDDDTKTEPAADAAAETTVNAEPVKDAPKTEAPAAEEPAAKPSRARRSRSDQRNDAGAMDDKDVVFGQSDQVPAFLKNF
ncbi:MAG TPA: DNA helicase [Rhodospirillaceae bacterium]|nr:DNA helicase [Magnetovibrio sp.]HCS72118.1 DNA helicase [Rhodospirillaceae bacterium]|tara:strand:- start:2357 stop:3877 length:1521 start_codon:yes stop_codon:yes gene_type:complete